MRVAKLALGGLVLLLAACDMTTGTPTGPGSAPTAAQSTATVAIEATAVTVAATNTAVLPTTAPPPPTLTSAAPPSATTEAATPPTPTEASPAPVADPPLALQPVELATSDSTRRGAFAQTRSINLPTGFTIGVYAAGLPDVRWLALGPDGLVYATVRGTGSVVTLPDKDGDGVADSVKTFAEGLPGVHGIIVRERAVYVATETAIIRLEDTDGDGVADHRDVLADDLPGGGGHSTRTLAFGADGKLYVSVGSSCNVCVESNPKRASISRYSAEGRFEKVYAAGLRNAVGLVFHPDTGELWATNNGRDGLGDDVPPEAIYQVIEDGNYGWPYCYGNRVRDTTQQAPAGFCQNSQPAAVEMQAHSAPLGLAFYNGRMFPPAFQGDLFVAFHGSWNRSTPTGYKLVRVRFADGQPDKAAGESLSEDFATGWRAGGNTWGRPVNPLVAADGALLLTDDETGAIYRIGYKP